jgi:hypothetical protein
MSLLQKAWESYKSTGKPDSVLDQALSTISSKTGMSADEIIHIADEIMKQKISFAGLDFRLTKTASSVPTGEELADMDPKDAADLIASILKGRNVSDKSNLVRSVVSLSEATAAGDIRATALTKSLKARGMWDTFERFFQKHVVPVRAGHDWMPSTKYLTDSTDFFYYWQEFSRGRGQGMPWYALMTVLSKFIFIVIRRLLKFGLVAGIAGVTAYGIYSAYKFFNPSGDTPKPAETAVQKDKPKETVDASKIVEQKLKQLYGPKNEKH